jgi:L-ascorbate metabolism protein UlaG (beta-lactamase superfamily)
MIEHTRLLPLFSVAVLLTGCPSSTKGLNIYRGETTHPLVTKDPGEVEVTYLGVGGYVIRRGGDALMFAPSFTNPGFLQLLYGLKTDEALVNRCMQKRPQGVEVGDVQWILVGHAHYDHLMDVPHVMRQHTPDAKVLGSRTARHLLAAEGLSERSVVVDTCAAEGGRMGKWLYNEKRTMRVLAIKSEHSPHWECIKLMGGHYKKDQTELSRTAFGWKEGQTYAYVVDFLDPPGENVVFRVHYQDAASTYPLGAVPEAAKEGYPRVDLAITTVGAYQSAGRFYPGLLLKNAQPRYIVLGHWEDFFDNQQCDGTDAEPKVVRLADIREFISRVERHKPADAQCVLPNPYTTMYLPTSSSSPQSISALPAGECLVRPGELPPDPAP